MGNNILSFRQKLTMDATAARNKILDEMTMAKSLASNHLRERQAAMERLRQWMSNDEEGKLVPTNHSPSLIIFHKSSLDFKEKESLVVKEQWMEF